MNIDRKLIRKQADFVMLNSCSVSSSGLYNGKAGMSWALFEIARLLDDEYMEDQAVRTLQEALLTQTKDMGFEKGLSGIGYVLLCLIRDRLIDADFDELFADKLALIHGYAGKLCADAAEGSLQIGGMKTIPSMPSGGDPAAATSRGHFQIVNQTTIRLGEDKSLYKVPIRTNYQNPIKKS